MSGKSIWKKCLLAGLFVIAASMQAVPRSAEAQQQGCTPTQAGWTIVEAASVPGAISGAVTAFRVGKYLAGCTGVGLAVLLVVDVSTVIYNQYQYTTTFFSTKLSKVMQQAMQSDTGSGELNLIEVPTFDLLGNESGNIQVTVEVIDG
jgi:hypothetical protein